MAHDRAFPVLRLRARVRVGPGILVALCIGALAAVGAPAAFPQTARAVAGDTATASPAPHQITPSSEYYNNTHEWTNNDDVGYCGDTSGGYVALAQVYLMNDGLYPESMYQVDDYYGPATESAVMNYQGFYGLNRDGCVGPSTWYTMEYTAANIYTSYCPDGSTYAVYGDGGSGTEGDGGYFTYDYLWNFTTQNDVGGPVAPQSIYALAQPLFQQNACAT